MVAPAPTHLNPPTSSCRTSSSLLLSLSSHIITNNTCIVVDEAYQKVGFDFRQIVLIAHLDFDTLNLPHLFRQQHTNMSRYSEPSVGESGYPTITAATDNIPPVFEEDATPASPSNNSQVSDQGPPKPSQIDVSNMSPAKAATVKQAAQKARQAQAISNEASTAMPNEVLAAIPNDIAPIIPEISTANSDEPAPAIPQPALPAIAEDIFLSLPFEEVEPEEWRLFTHSTN
ncbi:hypothetical protein B0T21DRAFT_408597 [Apiosordaria backusii]|uniref:Uncharacterized protein n=1 Tax=Apiosordaria backusii TaxID=314023 RepID=A0AA40K0U3_9PEZI|nr:hypothetical protein B0T21DRAFT_408597 [Apiosordaria backusii]